MTKIKLVIYGTGSLAEKIYYYNRRDSLFDIVGFIDDKALEGTKFYDLPVYSYTVFKELYKSDECAVFVAIGYLKCNGYREDVCKRVQKDGYQLQNYISPNSICFEDTILGKNILVCDNVFVGHGSKIMDGVVLSVGTTLSHENIIEPYCFISSCVVMGGHAHVKNNCFIGLHSTIRDSVIVGGYNIVGAGANLISSTDDYCVTIGNPGISTNKDTLSVVI